MKCEYCGVEIHPGTEVTFEGHNFCNSLHMQWWRNHSLRAAANPPAVPAAKPYGGRGKTKLIAGIAVVLLAAVVCYVGLQFGGRILGSGDAVDSQLVKISDEINKRCPMMVDGETRLDNTIALPGKTFVYNYTTVGISRDQADTMQLENVLRPRMINTMKTSPAMKYFRDNEVTLDYNYSDKSGAYLMQITVAPADYQ